MVPFSKRGLRATLVPLGLCVALAAVPSVASASIGLGAVVSANPANVTPNVASGAVHKLLQVGGTMYAGGVSSSVSIPAGVSPGGTFARSNLVAFNASTGVVASFAPSVNGEVWAMASDGASLWIGGTFTSVNGVARRGVANNPQGAGTAGPGAVSRPGHRRHPPDHRPGPALEPHQGPRRRRRQGPLRHLPGLWVGSDTNRIGGETRRRIALLPVP